MKDPHETKQDPFGHRTNPAHAERTKRIVEFLEDDAPFRRLLDVGCSEGLVTAHLAQLAAHTTGIDTSEVAIGRANGSKWKDEADFVVGDFVEYEPVRKFDLVVVAGMPHLFDDVPKFVDAVGRCMKKRGGRLLVSHVKSTSGGDGYLSRLEAAGMKAVRSGEFRAGGSEHSIHLMRLV